MHKLIATSLIFPLTLCLGCESSGGGSSAPNPASSNAAAETSKPKVDAKPSAQPTADPKPAEATAPPANALDDSGPVQGSCDTIKDSGGCTEHYNLGLSEESVQKECENPVMPGKWLKAKGCPKEARVAVCRTDFDRQIYYKNTFAPGNTVAEVSKLCTETINGKWAEFPKGK